MLALQKNSSNAAIAELARNTQEYESYSDKTLAHQDTIEKLDSLREQIAKLSLNSSGSGETEQLYTLGLRFTALSNKRWHAVNSSRMTSHERASAYFLSLRNS
jgi:hypothetical protein